MKPDEPVEVTYLLRVHQDTSQYHDLMLRQFLRRLPQWFPTLTPTQIQKILHDEADELTTMYQTENPFQMRRSDD